MTNDTQNLILTVVLSMVVCAFISITVPSLPLWVFYPLGFFTGPAFYVAITELRERR